MNREQFIEKWGLRSWKEADQIMLRLRSVYMANLERSEQHARKLLGDKTVDDFKREEATR
jgi:DNA-directed RNA polymerase delta subunit